MTTTTHEPSREKLLEIIRIQTEIARIGLDLGGVIAYVTEQARLLTGAQGAVLELAEDGDMVYRAASGSAEKQLGLRVPLNGSLSGLCVAEGRILRCEDSETDPRVDREACRKVGLRSMVVVPLRHQEKNVGVIKVLSPEVSAFSQESEHLLGLVSDLIAAAMFHATSLAEHDLYHRATHDPLTGLANRSLFFDRLRQSIAMAQRHSEQVAVLNLDMDGLKPINDHYGHRAGDAVINELARRISEHIRESDTAARLGGDEFGVILRKVADRDAVVNYCERLNENIRQPFRFDAHHLPISASIGFSVFPHDGQELEHLVEAADQSMYAVKRKRPPRVLHVPHAAGKTSS